MNLRVFWSLKPARRAFQVGGLVARARGGGEAQGAAALPQGADLRDAAPGRPPGAQPHLRRRLWSAAAARHWLSFPP